MVTTLSVFFKTNFTIFNDRFNELTPSMQREVREKVYSAEAGIAKIRLFIVLFNSLVFFLSYNELNKVPWLAYSVLLIANLYAFWVVIFHPYKKLHILLTSYFTSISDAILISFWLISTGGFESPFYLLFYASILAIALRYTIAATIVIGLLYSMIYVILSCFDLGIADFAVLLIRIFYLMVAAILGGMMSKRTLDQIEAKLLIRRSELEIRKSERKLRILNDTLEEKVRERTKELSTSNEKLKRAKDDLDNFVYTVTHDLKSPINNIRSLIDLLKHSELNSDDRKLIEEKIQLCLNTVSGKIKSIVELAKSNTESFNDRTSINLHLLLNEIINENSEAIKQSNASIQSDFSQSEEITFSMMGMKSILNNFLSNAINYKHPDRPPAIQIWSEVSDSWLMISVRDNGIGIDLEKNQEKLFGIFKRFHTEVEGAGIGLYMVKRIIEGNNGKIEVQSELGKGTTFKIYLEK